DKLCRMACSTLTNNQRQLGESVEPGHGDDAALTIDQLKLTAVLPERQRLALNETYIECTRQTPFDHRGAHPRPRLELFLNVRWAHRKDRGSGTGGQRRQDRLSIGRLASFDRNFRNGQTEQPGTLYQPVGGTLWQQLPMRRAGQLNRTKNTP